ncbi:MAG TPA: NAD(P)H-hydrate dehydratase [Clostridiales bacterium]|mgnify:CR=1|nr:NAD(P)H-hydrate dehydratase [Clostridiales bacterium]
MRVLTAEEMKSVEVLAAQNGISYYTMMENAGFQSAKIITGRIRGSSLDLKSDSVIILCGNGNNGGDGFVIAKYLAFEGYRVNVILVKGLPKSSEAKAHFNELRDLKVPVFEFSSNCKTSIELLNNADLIVDCVFGTGFSSEFKLDDSLVDLFTVVNSCKACVFSIDLPSGLESDSGRMGACYIKADHTIALSHLKYSHVLLPAAKLCGEVEAVDIGIGQFEPDSSYKCNALFSSDVKQLFKPLNLLAHKGDFGRLVSICGSYHMPGAATFAANAAVSSGVGLATCVLPDVAYPAISSKVTEPILIPVESNCEGTFKNDSYKIISDLLSKADCLLIGCGIGHNEDTKLFTHDVIKNTSCPMVIDADALNCLADNLETIKGSRAVLTPHPGEMARLTGLSVDEILCNRIEIAANFAKEYGVVLVLKGSNTLIVDNKGENVFINTTGNPGLATGGSGDVLAGIISSFLTQGFSSLNAAMAGVFIHGKAADLAAEDLSLRGLTPSRVIEYIPKALREYEAIENF